MAMLSRRSIGATLSAAAFALSPAGTANAAQTASHGVVVVAVGDDSGKPARALARDVYANAALLFPVTPRSDASAQVLLGEPWPKDAAPSVIELGKVREALGKTESEAAERRLLASIGLELNADFVVAVRREGEGAAAKILRCKSAAYEPDVLKATAEKDASGEISYRFADAVPTLVRLVQAGEITEPAAPAPPPAPPPASAAAPPPLRPTATPAPASALKTPGKQVPAAPKPEPSPVWKSTWFWVAIGGAAAIGLTAFGIAKATEGDDNMVHLSGRISK